MTKNQEKLLNNLRLNLYDLALEAEYDENFNLELADIDIFSRCINDVLLDIDGVLE